MNNVGFENVMWFMGVVENIDKATGRVQVRCFGVHPTYAEDPDFDLPWATPVNGTYGAMGFIPKVAEWVIGFFIDGRDAQKPILIGSIPGATSTLPFGSNDPAENHYVKPTKEAIENFGTAPLHPAITGEDVNETPVTLAESLKKESVTSDGSSISEPDIVTGGEASYVSVVSSGHAKSYVEVSGSEGNEHITLVHNSGAHVQIDPSGTIKLKSTGDMFTGSEGNSGEYVEGRKDLIVDGKYTISVNGGDCVLKVAGDLVFDAKNNIDFNVSGKVNFNVAESINMTGSKLNFHAREDDIDIYAGSKLRMFSQDNMSIRTDSRLFQKSDRFDHVVSGSYKVRADGIDQRSTSKFAIEGTPFYVDSGSTFIDGDPNFNSGQASGQASSASNNSEVAAPIKQDNLDSRAVVQSSPNQDRITVSTRSGAGYSAHDDVVDISFTTSEFTSPNSGSFRSEVFRNEASGVAGSLLELIGDVEANGDYNIVFFGSKIALSKPPTSMTIQEIIDWQTDSVSAGSASSAIGKYQVIKKTLIMSVNALGISKSELFDASTQDRIAYYLLERRGLSSYISGNITNIQFGNELSKEWAALPLLSGPRKGQSYYQGDGLNQARASVSSVISAIDNINTSGGVSV